MPEKYVKRILESRVYDVALETPLDVAPLLSKRLGCTVCIKREDLQPVFSFKLRGAYNRISRLSVAERKRGVIAASAGNHAQGVALAAARLNIKALIVMPVTTPEIKVAAVRERGARVILQGDTFDEAYLHARNLEQEQGLVFVHPYDDPDVIAGQGTIAMELLRQTSEVIDAVFVPVGGGGLIAGIATYIKYLRPSIKVIGVEAEDSACLAAALKAGRRVTLPTVGIFADGVAVAQIGKEPFHLARRFVDEVLTVDTDAICAAIKDLFADTRSVAEPAGALALAGLKQFCETRAVQGKRLIAINSGANVNFDRLRHISERAEFGEKREAIFAVTIPERPGSFRRFCRAIGKRDVSEFNYRYADAEEARVFVGVKLRQGENERRELLAVFRKIRCPAIDLTEDELAKVHVRHMVGGRAPGLEHERLFQFQFPERPGALLAFLDGMSPTWNISLFHYRNHGAAFGRVLMGLQVPEADDRKLMQFLKRLGYPYREVSGHPAYELFLG